MELSKNDPIFVSLLIRQAGVCEKITTVLPKSWVFHTLGNIQLKRKRKNTTATTKEKKLTEWLVHTCSVHGKKVSRDKRAMYLTKLSFDNLQEVEEEIKAEE